MWRRSERTADPGVPGWLERGWNSRWPWIALIVLLFSVPLFTSLHQQDFENDEAIYSYAVDTMLKDGDWLTPKSTPSETAAFLEKPPLKFWIVALPIKLGLLPANEFGMRFWDAVMASVAFLYVFAIGRRLAGPVCGFAAVFLLFTHHPLLLTHGLRTNNMEAAVFLSYAAGIYHFMAWRTAGPDDRRHIFAIALYFVLAFMTKFVAALFLPLLLVLAVLVKPEDRLRLRFTWPTIALAGLLALALIAPWFIYQQLTHPREFFASLIGEHVVKRFTAHLDPTHLHPWHYYFTELWRGLRESGAAALVVFGSGLLLVETWRRRWLEGALIVLWFAVPMVLISLGTSKLYHYAYPFLPPVALAGGYGVARVAALLWRRLERPAQALAAARNRSFRFIRPTPVRVALISLGVATPLIAIATLLWGPIHLVVDGTLLLRNATVFRPFAVGALLLLIGGPAIAVRALIPTLLVVSVLPISAYSVTTGASRRLEHTLGNARACLAPIAKRFEAADGEAPGVWVEAEGISHRFNYYLRGLGPWRQRPIASDTTVATHLFEPGSYRPVLITETRYHEFMTRLGDSSLLERTATHAGVTIQSLVDGFHQTELSVIRREGAVLLLPGPYSACGAEPGRGPSR